MEHVQNSSHDVRLSSDDQSIWASGDRAAVTWSDYFPIIGGDRKHFEVLRAEVTEGRGKVTVDGERINWDPEGEYDRLRGGQVEIVSVEIHLVDEEGNRSTRTVEIEARGTAAGTGYVIPETGQTSVDELSFAAVDAGDILDDAHHFEKVVPIDLDFDAMRDFGGAIEAVGEGLQTAENAARAAYGNATANEAQAQQQWDDASEAAGLVNETIARKAVFDAASVAFNAADAAYKGAQAAKDVLDDANLDVAAKQAAKTAAAAAVAAAQTGLNAAQNGLNAARAAESAARSAVNSATNTLNSLIDDVQDALDLAPPFVKNAFNWVADFLGIDDDIERAETALDNAQATLSARVNALTNAQSAFTGAQNALNAAQNALNAADNALDNAIDAAADAAADFAEALAGKTLGALQKAVDIAEDARDDARDAWLEARQEMWDADVLVGRNPSAADLAKVNADAAAKLAKLGAAEAAKAAAWAALKAAEGANDLFEAGIDDTDFQLEAELSVEAHAQAGLQVDVVLDAGSVDSDIDYKIDATTTHDTEADTFTIKTLATNETTGESVAFETVSPNLKFYAGIAYDIGATFEMMFDLYGKFAGIELFDLPGGDEALTLTKTLSMDGWIDLVDFDSTDLGSLDIDLPLWLGDILSAEFNVPTVETEGKEAEVSADVYQDPTFVNIEAMADAVLAIAEAKLEFSPEFRAMLIEQGIKPDLTDSGLANALVDALSVIYRTVTVDGDTDGDGVVPIFMLKTGDDNRDGLVHLNTIEDVIGEVNIDEVGKLGFFVGSGESDNLFEVEVDVDQLIATIVNVAYGNAPDTTINPLDLSIGLDDVLDYAAADPATRTMIEKYLKFDLSAEAMDFDVRAGANFSQEFALSVDDMMFRVEFEDGTTGSYKASEGGEIVIENASELVDTNGNGEIDYRIDLTPDATFFNDTQVGLNVGYTLDLLKAKAAAALNLPLSEVFPELDLPDLPIGVDLGLGPLLRLEGDLDLLSADLFEDIFDYDAGSAFITGSFEPVEDGVSGVIRIGDDLNNKLKGTNKDDILDGKGGNDKLIGKDGDDELIGGEGKDKLNAGKGDDELRGDAGKDLVLGHKGNDQMYGGEDADTFVLKKGHGSDVIHDFEIGVDVIQVRKGAEDLSDLSFDQDGDDVVMAFANVETRVVGVTVAELELADNFLF